MNNCDFAGNTCPDTRCWNRGMCEKAGTVRPPQGPRIPKPRAEMTMSILGLTKHAPIDEIAEVSVYV